MSFRRIALAGAMLPFVLVSQIEVSLAADQDPPPVKAKAKPVADVPFFFVIDDRVTYSWMPKGTDPGAFSFRPDGSINACPLLPDIDTCSSLAPFLSLFSFRLGHFQALSG